MLQRELVALAQLLQALGALRGLGPPGADEVIDDLGDKAKGVVGDIKDKVQGSDNDKRLVRA